ncbi:MAG: rod shape-determining protein MreD [Victivallales bacterium]|nr:rod shape-determining protein MreD [Victivallales bacterium]
MGTNDKQTTGGGNALFEFTLTVHPHVLINYLLSKDGFWRHFWILFLTILWLITACVSQLALSEYFPELPLYPVPLTIAYLAYYRKPSFAVISALVCGILLDSLTFGRLGVSSGILGLVVVLIDYLSHSMEGLEKRFWERCLLLGGGSVFIYVLLKLGLYFAFPNGDDVLSLVPKQLLLGTLLCGTCLAPLMFSAMDLIEWLFRLRSAKPESDDSTAEMKPRQNKKHPKQEKATEGQEKAEDDGGEEET